MQEVLVGDHQGHVDTVHVGDAHHEHEHGHAQPSLHLHICSPLRRVVVIVVPISRAASAQITTGDAAFRTARARLCAVLSDVFGLSGIAAFSMWIETAPACDRNSIS